MKKIIIFSILLQLVFCSGNDIKKITYNVTVIPMSSRYGFHKREVLITYKDESGEMVSLTHDCSLRGFIKEINVRKNFQYHIKAQVKENFPCRLDVIIYEGNPYNRKKISSKRKEGVKPKIVLFGKL